MIKNQPKMASGEALAYDVIWNLKTLYLIHNKCGARIEVKPFEKGFHTPERDYQKYVQRVIVKHKC